MLRMRGLMGTSDVAGPQAPAFSPRVRLALALAAMLALAGALLRWALLLEDAVHSIAGRYDFSSYYAAALALRNDPHANIYAESVIAHAGAAGHVLVQPPLPYTYPPLFAILLAPFTAVSFRILSRLWLVGNAALWLALTLLLAAEMYRLLPRLSASRASARGIRDRAAALVDDPLPLVAVAVAAWLCLPSAPAVQTLLTGQINFLVLAPLALVPLLLRRGRDFWAGAAIGLAAMLKFTPALLIAYLILMRRWRAVAGALIALAVLAAGSIAVVGPGVFFAALTQALRVGSGDATLGHNEALFAPMLTLLGNPAPAQVVAQVLSVALVVALGYVLWRGSAADPSADPEGDWARPAAGYGIALCALLLVSPSAWVHHYVWVLPAAASALGLGLAGALSASTAQGCRQALLLLGLAVVAALALSYSLPYGWDTEPQPAQTSLLGLPLWPLLLEARALATLALALVLSYWYLRRTSVAVETTPHATGVPV